MPPAAEVTLTPALGRPAASSLSASLTAGAVGGLRTVLGTAAITALILPPGVADGGRLLTALLFGGAVVGLLLAWLSAYRGVIAQPQDGPAVLVGVFSAVIAGSASGIAADRVPIVVLGAVAFSSFVTGIVFYALGYWRLGRLVRFIPYPVIGGFLAGSGLLITLMALNVLAGERLLSASWSSLQAGGRLPVIVFGALFGVALYVTLRRIRHYLTLPVVLLGSALLFHLVVHRFGLSHADLQATGWLITSSATGGGSWLPGWVALNASEWSFLVANVLTFAAVAVVSIVAMLLNLSGLEVATRSELDFNRELRLTGIANMAGALVGGAVGFHALSASLLGHQMGANSRSIGITAVALALAVLAIGPHVLGYIPLPLLGALLLCIGFGLLQEWIVGGWSRFSRAEYLTIVVIMLVMTGVGYLAGVGAGIVLSTVFFVWSYSRVKVITQELAGTDFHSNVERPPDDLRLLEREGGRIRVLKVEGFLFFGTAYSVLDRIQQLIDDGARFVVLDLAQVKAADSSALSVFTRIGLLCQRNDTELHLTRANAALQAALIQQATQGGVAFRHYDDRDFAIEHCENALLARERVARQDMVAQAWERIATQLECAEDLDDFKSYLALRDFSAGDYLMRQGDESDALFLVEYGRVQILLHTDGDHDIRLRSMTAGALVGEVGLCLSGPRTASARAETPTRTYCLTRGRLSDMERERPALAQALHRAIVRLLSERLAATNRLIQRLDP